MAWLTPLGLDSVQSHLPGVSVAIQLFSQETSRVDSLLSREAHEGVMTRWLLELKGGDCLFTVAHTVTASNC